MHIQTCVRFHWYIGWIVVIYICICCCCCCCEKYIYIYYKYCSRYTITISWINSKCIYKTIFTLSVMPKGSARTILWILLTCYNYWKCNEWIRAIWTLKQWTVNLSGGNNSLKLPPFSNTFYTLLIASSAMHIFIKMFIIVKANKVTKANRIFPFRFAFSLNLILMTFNNIIHLLINPCKREYLWHKFNELMNRIHEFAVNLFD